MGWRNQAKRRDSEGSFNQRRDKVIRRQELTIFDDSEIRLFGRNDGLQVLQVTAYFGDFSRVEFAGCGRCLSCGEVGVLLALDGTE